MASVDGVRPISGKGIDSGTEVLEPKAHAPSIGTLDFCFIASVPLEQVIASLEKHKVTIIEGPCIKTGAMGKIRSVYFRDPNLNLVEVSDYV